MVSKITVRGARVHNLKNIDLDIPLNHIVGVAGVSGSGKSSLALGVLYSEGSRRYLESLSTYTRRRLTQAARADVDEVLHVPAALALHQRPAVPGIRSTFGTGTELLNTLRLMFSRLGAHVCPNGHVHAPTLDVAAEKPLVCATCGVTFDAPGAEDLSFNSRGACPTCDGTGIVRTVDRATLVPDDTLTIDEGAVLPWKTLMWSLMTDVCRAMGVRTNGIVRTVDRATLVPDDTLTIDEGAVLPWKTLMWSLMTDVCRAMGVRTNVPFRDLTADEKAIVYDGPAVKKHIFYHPKGSNDAAELDFTYFSAVRTVENALSKVKDESGMKRVERFLKMDVCPDCGSNDAAELDFTYFSAVRTVENALSKVKDESGMKRVERFLKMDVCPDCLGTRYSEAARAPTIAGVSIDVVSQWPLVDVVEWVKKIPETLPAVMRPMAMRLCDTFIETAGRLLELGLGYLSLDRAGSTLSTGERQRMQLARAVRNRTTGVLYVLDEPSIGLHPANLQGLKRIMHDLVADGNSVILVDHDVNVLSEADWVIEMGPKAGREGGFVLAEGPMESVKTNPKSMIAPYLKGEPAVTRPNVDSDQMFALGRITLSTLGLHTVKPMTVTIPKGRLTVVTGVSGSGKTTLVLESLLPGLKALCDGSALPAHVASIDVPGIHKVKLIDASPIGMNVRSTVATYADVHDELRKAFARTPDAKAAGFKAGDFSYNTGKLRCPVCDGTGVIRYADVHDELRKAFARTPDAKAAGFKAGDFSYNTGKLRCPVCDGTGVISLDVQFLPDVDVPCPACHGTRYSKTAGQIRRVNKKGEAMSLPALMGLNVTQALEVTTDMKSVQTKLKVLDDLGLGYLTLGEATPGLSGGEAQRLKLAGDMGRGQADTVFILDEPTIGLHPENVKTLMAVFDHLIDAGATVIVIEHDLDVIRSADWMIDLGPGGGDAGGQLVYVGVPSGAKANKESVTGRFL